MNSTSVVIDAVAAVAAARIKRLYGESLRGMARIRGFTADEVLKMVGQLDPWAAGQVELLVISSTPPEGLAPKHLIGDGKSATTYRNRVGSCVFFEIDRFSDEQGLKNVTTLTDGNLLRESARRPTDPGPDALNVAACVDAFDIVWKLRTSSPAGSPHTVRAALAELLEVFNEQQRRLAVREWIKFSDRYCTELPSGAALDATAARRALGLSLPELKLFPDAVLAELAGEVPRRRRLIENLLAAQDRTKSGKEIDREELGGLVQQIDFRDNDGEPLSPHELTALRSTLRGYLEAYERASTEGIEFRFWKQLFEHRTARRGMGTRVRDDIEARAPDRLEELLDLDVLDELDGKEAGAAQRLLDEDPDDEEKEALADLLSARVRKAVERIANPTAKATSQPLRHILQLFHALAEEEHEEPGSLRLEIRKSHGTATNDRLSRALFAFLYGPTLSDVADRSEGTFSLTEDLRDPSNLVAWIQEANENGESSDEEVGAEWGSLRLQLRWEDEKTGSEFFEWRPAESPGFALLAKAVHQNGQWRWATPLIDFDEWCAKALDAGQIAGGDSLPPRHALTREWLDQRRSVLASIARNGLSPNSIRDYVAIWGTILDRARSEHVPEGASDPAIAEFLAVDVHRGTDGTPTLIGTHPLRLRWIGENLAKLSDQLVAARRGKLNLNAINEEFFFRRTAQASPHEQPPILCDDSHIYVAVRENCWHERYEVVRTRDRTLTDWLADLDDSSLDEMAGALGQYVDAFPYKADGLHLLIVAREGGARMVREIIGRFLGQVGLTGRRSEMRLVLHLVCPAKEFSPVSDAISEFDDSSERANRDFPRFRVVLHEWTEGERTPPAERLPENIDVAVVPNLFSAGTRCQEATRPQEVGKGIFDPWLDPPTVREAVSEGIGAKSVSRILVPEQRDELLANWSTVNVRHYRGAVVGSLESAREDMDVVTLSVAVSDGESFFAQLHERAHWVVTLDAFVGRRQIEALEHRPEVITVKPGLGKGGAYTLVVSSQVGREFVIHRLARRLGQQLGNDLGMDPETVAERIYDRARELAPGTLLKAIGLGRTAQELVGLVVSQRLVKQFQPIYLSDNSFESWIALDERLDWFGGNRNARADLLRVCGTLTPEGLRLSLTVVEAKLRDQSAIRKAQAQLDATTALLEGALIPAEQGAPHDGEFWRRAFLDAIDESAREPQSGGGWTFRAKWGGRPARQLHADARDAIRSGAYSLHGVQGIACTLGPTAVQELEQTPNGRHLWIRASRKEAAQVLRNIGLSLEEDSPDTESTSPEATPAAVHQEQHPELISREERGDVVIPASDPAPVQGVRGLAEDDLTRRYQQVLDTFSEYGLEVAREKEMPVQEGPGFFIFRVRPGIGIQPGKLLSQIDNLKYSLQLPAELHPRAFIDRGAVVFEVPKREEERYYVDAGELWDRLDWPQDRLWVAVGEDVSGDPVSIDFSSSETPHLLIGGITGAGKSVALETILLGLIRHYPSELLRIAAIDPKRTELVFLEDYPRTAGPIGFDSDDALELLDQMVQEMESRYELMRAHRVRSLHELNQALQGEQRKAWQLVVLDEFADLTSDRDAKKEIEASLQRLTQKARAAGIHVIVATQKPSADVISTTVRSNLGAQLALRVKTATDSRIIMDAPGAEALAGNGDAFLKRAGAVMTRLQCAKVSPAKS